MAIVVIEGLDGAGKSTQIDLLRQHLNNIGIPTEFLHFPRVDAPVFGELIAKFLRGDLGKINQVDPYVVALLYACDRSDAANLLKQWTLEGKTVLLDRYVYSNVAFQCAKLPDEESRKALREWIYQLEYERFAIPRPTLNIFLDVPFDFIRQKLTAARLGNDRAYLQGKTDIHEADLDFQRRVRQVYIEQQDLDPLFHVIDCGTSTYEMMPPHIIHNKIVEMLDNCLNNSLSSLYSNP